MNKFIEMEREKEWIKEKLLQCEEWIDDLDDDIRETKDRLNEVEENEEDISSIKRDIRDLEDWQEDFDIEDYMDGYNFDDFIDEDKVKEMLEEEIPYQLSNFDISEIAGDNFINTITKEVVKRIWEVTRNEILSKI